jgi:hypothetical protein
MHSSDLFGAAVILYVPERYKPMLVLALFIWLLAIILCSFGVQHLWAPARRSRIVVLLMAPGVIIHEVSHVVACLLTGASVKDVSLSTGGVSGRVEHTRPLIPVLGQALISLAPVAGCGFCLWLATTDVLRPAAEHFGRISRLPSDASQPADLARYFVSVLQETGRAAMKADFTRWQTYVLLYLSILMAVHLSPSRRDLRNGLLSLVVLGLAGFGVAQMKPNWFYEPVKGAWPFLTLSLALSLLVLLLTLFWIGMVQLLRLMIRPEGGAASRARPASPKAPK